MADDQTTTQQDTTTSESDATVTDAATSENAEQQTATDKEAAATADTSDAGGDTAGDDDGTALGGKDAADENSEEGDKPSGAPEAYELKLEGTDLDPEAVADAEPLLREAGLTNEQANTILPAAAKLVERTQTNTLKALTDAAAQQKKDWLDIAKSDEEIGGAKWDDTMHLAAKGLDALGFVEGHPFRKALNETGFGNNRDMIFMARKVGELVGEDGFIRSDAAARSDLPTETRWYGKKGD